MAGLLEASSLHRPLTAQERNEPDYSPLVEHDLLAAFRHLAAGASRSDAYLRAHALGWSNLSRPMSTRQRMQAFFVLGSAFLGGHEIRLGRECLDEALDLAEDLRDWGAWVELAHLHAAASGTLFVYEDAATLLEEARRVLHVYGMLPDDASLHTGVASALALAYLMLEEFEAAWQAVGEAEAVAEHAVGASSHTMTLDWIKALLYRWQGAPERGLRHALAAAERSADDTTPHSQLQRARLFTDVVECALDLAELYPSGAPRLARTGLLALAAPYAEQAIALAKQVEDPATSGIAQLAKYRLRRLSHYTLNNRQNLEQIRRRAVAERDLALLARVDTEIGQDLAQRGDHDAALASFRTALDVLGPSEIPALGRWARQALVSASRH